MNKYWITYKPFLLFLGKFVLTYLILTFFYQLYLSNFDLKANQVDDFTKLVSQEVEQTLLFFEKDVRIELHPQQPCYKFFYSGKYISRIVEGCNALSVIILFISFIIAFTGKIKHTILFVILGSLIIHILNITRIALLLVAFYNFPAANTLLHDILFPLVIYGTVFILWIIWVNNFSFYAKKTLRNSS